MGDVENMRCEYEHDSFKSGNIFTPYGKIHDGARQCWMTGDDVAEFENADGVRKKYCIFHAPEGWKPVVSKYTEDGSPLNAGTLVSPPLQGGVARSAEGVFLPQSEEVNSKNDLSADFDKNKIGAMQAEKLKELLTLWNTENEKREENDKLTFALPGMNCGEINLKKFPFSSSIEFASATFSGDAGFGGATFSGDAGFSNATFSGDAGFHSATFSGDAGFHSATFSGDAGFHSATFSGDAGFDSATFSGDARFYGATFSGDARFYGATFSWNAGFDRATFSGNAGFDRATFSWDAQFRDATFSGDAGFDRATFSREAWFHSATFSGEAWFHSATFSGEAWFHSATFSGDAWFHSATFSGDAGFDRATFSGNAGFDTAKFKKKTTLHQNKFDKSAVFVNCEINSMKYSVHLGEKLLFNHCEIADKMSFTNQDCSRLSFLNMSLSKADFLGADVRNTRFDSCGWHRPEKGAGYAKVFRHDKIVYKTQGDDRKDQLFKLKSLYRQLMKNLEDNRDYKQAGDFHYRDMELRQLLLRESLDTQESVFERPMLWVYHTLSDFGENYVRLFGLLLAVPMFIAYIGALMEGAGHYGWRFIAKYGAGWLFQWAAFDFGRVYKAALLSVIPFGLTKSARLEDFVWINQIMFVVNSLFMIVIGALFLMAINRRYRR